MVHETKHTADICSCVIVKVTLIVYFKVNKNILGVKSKAKSEASFSLFIHSIKKCDTVLLKDNAVNACNFIAIYECLLSLSSGFWVCALV